jgi:RNA polymerase sigma factor (sigma-70 family)
VRRTIAGRIRLGRVAWVDMEAFDPPDDDDHDADIEDALRRGDKRTALTLLMARYGQRVLRYAYAMLHDQTLAEDVRQQVFVQALRDLDQFAFRAPIRAWLFCIARNRSLDAAKHRSRWRCRFGGRDAAPDEAAPGDPGEQHDRHVLAKLLARCLQKLSPSARDAVVMRYHEGLSFAEASKRTGEQAGTLQRRVERAMPVLRRCLDDQLGRGSR